MQPSQYVNISVLVLVLDLCGTFVFALSGAVAGIKYRLDLFGVLVLSFAAANSGGILRDLLIGAVPPPGIGDWRYVAVPVLAGLATLRWGPMLARVKSSVQILDAGGLALFAVSGAQKALDFHLGPVTAMLLGMLTGIGGGMVRDVLSAQIPSVLRGDVYAIAALAGAGVVVVGSMMHLPSVVVTIAGAVLCFALRFMAIRRHWQLPVAVGSDAWGAKSDRPAASRDAGAGGAPR
ncbi:MAG TPA: trimeric intracellular cation channel family protein [Gemmatimonadaceae bacterium]|nr:trimeric intracellular cation channel family protein [Gemmatimonadaceae bacterium]